MRTTKLLKIENIETDGALLDEAAALIAGGGLVAIPTETVYGLAADATNETAVKAIFEAKGRPQDNPLIVHICDTQMLYEVAREVPPAALRLAARFWPGPLTIILPKSDKIPMVTSAGLDTVAIRFPSHPVARELIRRAGVAVAAPSANLSGSPSTTAARHCIRDLTGRVDAIVDGGDCSVGVESTVVTLACETPRLLRPGYVTLEQLREVLGEVEVDKAVTAQPDPAEKAASPGMKYKHYAPKCKVVLVESAGPRFAAYVNSRRAGGEFALCYDEDIPLLECPSISIGARDDEKTQAIRLFDSLRRLDDENAQVVYARCPAQSGVGLALYNRLIRAAAFEVVKPARVIGLTGQTGAGKTTVSGALAQKGLDIINCDLLARQVTERGTPCLSALAARFDGILNPDGSLNRKKLGGIVFCDKVELAALDEIIYPYIKAEVQNRINKLWAGNSKGIVLDAPTLFESGADGLCDEVVAVVAPPAVRRARIMRRDGIGGAAAEARMASQRGDEFYTARSRYVLRNTGTEAELLTRARALADELLGE